MKKIFSLVLLVLVFIAGNAQKIDFDSLKNVFPNVATLTLKKHVSVDFLEDQTSGKITATVTYEMEELALKANSHVLGVTQVVFNTYQLVDVKSAKYYKIDTTGTPKMKERVKVKYLEEKDYFVSGIFYNDIKVKQFAPEKRLGERTVLKYKYVESYEDLKFLTRVYAQDYMKGAVLDFKLQVNIPNTVELEVVPFNVADSVFKVSNSTNELSASQVFSAAQINAIDAYGGMPPANYLLPHFFIQVKSIIENGQKNKVIENLDDLYAWYASLIQNNQQDEYIVNLTNELVAGATTTEEKIEIIFSWVQDHVQYVAFEDGLAGFKPEDAGLVCKKRYGDCKGMANLLVSMLSVAGIEAHHCWIGTKSLPYDYSIPSLGVDNHMICAISLNNQIYFLDATDKSTRWNEPSGHIQGKSALIDMNGAPKVQKVPVLGHDQNNIFVQATVKLEEGPFAEVSGSVIFEGNYYNKYRNWLKHVSITDADAVAQFLVRNYFEDFVMKGNNVTIEDLGGSIKLTFNGLLTGAHFKNSEGYFIMPPVGQNVADFLKGENEVYPVYLENEFTLNYKIKYLGGQSLRLSDGVYNVNGVYRDGESAFNIKCSQSGEAISFESQVVVNTGVVTSDKLLEWNQYLLELRGGLYSALKLNK